MFEHFPYQFPQLERVDIDGRRHYLTPEGNAYPSVTTVLGDQKSQGLQDWINEVGEVEASKRKVQGANRGTLVHAIYEDFVNNQLDITKYDPITYELFRSSERYLREGMGRVFNLEFRVYSDRLKTAGAGDNFCEWEGIPSVVDYKTSKRRKDEEWIVDYFLQETTYAMMIFERIEVKVPQIVTFLVNETDPEPQIFVKKTEDYIGETLKRFREYHRRYA